MGRYSGVLVVLVVLGAASGQRFGRPLPPGGAGFGPGIGPGMIPELGHGMGPGMRPEIGPGMGTGNGHRPGFSSFGDPDGGGGFTGLGAPCEYDEHCYSMEHTFCRNHQSCDCKRGFLPSSAGDRCLATVGARCDSKYDCAGLGPGGDCRQGVCDCGANHVPAPSSTSCLKAAEKINSVCLEDLQCETLGEGAVCMNGKCQCGVGKHAYNDRCYANRGLHMSCNEHADCYIGDGYQSIIQCYMGTCRCREHYVDGPDNTCVSGAEKVQALLVFVILSLFISCTIECTIH